VVGTGGTLRMRQVSLRCSKRDGRDRDRDRDQDRRRRRRGPQRMTSTGQATTPWGRGPRGATTVMVVQLQRQQLGTGLGNRLAREAMINTKRARRVLRSSEGNRR
jgi:hypothetical protein